MNRIQLVKQALMLEDYINTGACPNRDWGLCWNVLMDGHYSYWDGAFLAWTEFSGSFSYPIEGNARAFDNNDQKHDRRTTYGKLRLSLAKHCLEYVMNELREVV